MRRSLSIWMAIALILAFGTLFGCGGGITGEVSFVQPADGADVISPFWVQMRASEELIVEPAFAFGVISGGVGHFSVVVGDTTPPNPEKTIKPGKVENIWDFPKGQEAARVSIPKGQHTLSLYFTRNNGLPYSEPYITQTITVNVLEHRSATILEPKDRDSVVSPFTVKIGSEGIELEPASAGVTEGHGHHHILVDKLIKRSPTFNDPLESISIDQIPAEDGRHYIHLEEGQSEIVLDLPTGQHTIRLLVGKGDNMPYDPPITDFITVNVREK